MRYLKNRSSGFTLLELMAVVIILAIIAAFAVPSFQEMIRRNRITGYSSEMVTAVQAARSEAIKLGATVSLRPLASSDFAAGWEIVAENFNKKEVLLGKHDALSNAEIRPVGSGSAPTEIKFNPRGGLQLESGDKIEMLLVHKDCSSGKEGARHIIINAVGRAMTSLAACP
jgi:prepilin-type N-terminal cleavage/methylation domain-containing protein